jgi:hypothetical protein
LIFVKGFIDQIRLLPVIFSHDDLRESGKSNFRAVDLLFASKLLQNGKKSFSFKNADRDKVKSMIFMTMDL